MSNTNTPGVTALLDRPIAFHRVFVDLTGSVTAALMLSQAVYWNKRCPTDDGREPSWWYKNREEWTGETGLTRREQESARKILVRLGVLHERRSGNPARLWYKVDEVKLTNLLGGNRPSSWSKSAHQNGRKPPNSHSTETTSENTSELSMKNRKISLNALPEWLDKKAWNEFEDHRREIGKPLTNNSRAKNISVLDKHRNHQSEIIDRSIAGGWTGLFPPKGNTGMKAGSNKPPKAFPSQETQRGH